MGRPKEGSELAKAIGRRVEGIRTGRVLQDNQVIAVEVELPAEIRALCTNRVPHVTIAVNPSTGGKPVMSNFLPWGTAGRAPQNDPTISGTILVVGD
jgi:tRNA splicing ligase